MSTSTTETDYVTEKIGKFGKFQLRGFLLIQFVWIISAWQTFVRLEPDLTSSELRIHFQSSSFLLPEVEFWCSPASLQLGRGERSDSSLVSPRREGTNVTDHCLMFTGQSDNTTQCSRSETLSKIAKVREQLAGLISRET